MYYSEPILHIDDSADFTRAVGVRLKKLRFHVVPLNDARCWRETIEELNAGVILLDVDLGPLDGLKILEQIRQMNGDRRVILLTGMVSMTNVMESMWMGADFCFFKDNFDFAALTDAITSLQFRRTHWCRAAMIAANAGRSERVRMPGRQRQPIQQASTGQLPHENHVVLAKRFLKVLHDRGHLTTTEIQQLVDDVETHTPRIGQLALETGLMTMKGVFHVLQEQTTTPSPFGEIAVTLGYLRPSDVSSLLAEQEHRSPDLVALCEERYGIPRQELATLLSTLAPPSHELVATR